MSELKSKEFDKTAVVSTASGSKDLSAKPVVAFKFQKSLPKVKNTLQGSMMKVFFSPELDISVSTKINQKNIFSNTIQDSKSIASDIEMREDDDIKHSYTEPPWSGIPEDIYKIEILKSGVILNSLDLSQKSYNTVGQSLSCDISLTHETISQYHAVLQYRKIADSENEKGVYVYDLNSTYGTFVNGHQIKPNEYISLRGGYILTFGRSNRKYILQTPTDHKDYEADLSAAELQELKKLESQEEERLRQETLQKEKQESLDKENELKEINWGIAEDMEENSMLTESSESPDNENDLFLDDPKKALTDWFKWEGYDLEYQTEDRGFGGYSCWIDLPLDPTGTMERVRVNVLGDKNKAIEDCALKACRVLNEYGFLRQAQKEKKSISRNWEDVDYYDSDDDNFLDRTGVVERKRQRRMQIAGKCDLNINNDELMSEKYSKIVERIKNLENELALRKNQQNTTEDSDKDALDTFMSNLNTATLNKSDVCKIKIELRNLYKEKSLIMNSINLNLSKSVKADISESCLQSITEKTKNGCRFNV